MNPLKETTETALRGLIQAIETLCLENEVAQKLLQENWPPQQTISARLALSRGCKAGVTEFRSRMPISDTKLLSKLAALPHDSETLRLLTEAIEATRSLTSDRIDRTRGTL